MISYDPKQALQLVFSVRGTIWSRVIVRVGVLVGMTALLCVWQTAASRIPDLNRLRFPQLETVGHLLLGIALGLLIVFRTNSSYDRYWEGRKLWGGIVNSSRNLLRAATAYVGDTRALANLVSAYALALKQHLRSNKDLTEVQPLVSPALFAQASAAANPPAVIAYHLSAWVQDRVAAGKIDTVLARQLDSRVNEMIDYQGGCERILRTPIPFAYAVHIKQLLTIYLLTLPFVLVSRMDWYAPLVMGIVAFGLLGIEEAGVEIEDPFGDDPNDLPIEAICATVSRDTGALSDLAAPVAVAGATREDI